MVTINNMSEIFFTSDLHFFHNKILEYCPHSRPFDSVDEMNDAIITNWNNIVSPNDKTYILGDVSFGNSTKTVEMLNSLNGEKHLIIGNHDSSYLRVDNFIKCFESVQNYLEIKYNKQFICMFHYPIDMWNRKHYGSLHLHGHLHSTNDELTERKMDVGVDSNNLIPYHLNEVIEKLTIIPYFNKHHPTVKDKNTNETL
jgi:calcineurin-like phosphoesterase family protein